MRPEPLPIPGASEQRFLALLEEHAGILHKVAATYARTAEDRRDLEQEIIAQLWRAFPPISIHPCMRATIACATSAAASRGWVSSTGRCCCSPSRTRASARSRPALRRVAWRLRYELAAGVVATVLLGSFLADHWREARFLVSALVLHGYAVFSIVLAARQLVLLSRVDLAGPVLDVQRTLIRLRTFRIRVTLGWMILAPMLWTPLAIVAAKGGFDVDLYRSFGAPWVWTNLSVGLALIPLGAWLARRLAARAPRSARLAALADMLAGRSLADAKRDADELVRFAVEP